MDLIYLCYPNNPTGAVLGKDALKRWVDYARREGAVILYDAAYESYIRDPAIPRTIYEIEGAQEVAIELRSFSKTAGFTGVRCAYTVVPKACMGRSASGEAVSLHALWFRRQSTKFNGVSYIIQKGAAAAYSPEGQKQVRESVDFYLENARIIREGVAGIGLTVYGGTNAPYIWVKTPKGLGSWDLFDKLLNEAHVVSTPGAGFGPSGEGYLRLTAFGSREQTVGGGGAHQDPGPALACPTLLDALEVEVGPATGGPVGRVHHLAARPGRRRPRLRAHRPRAAPARRAPRPLRLPARPGAGGDHQLRPRDAAPGTTSTATARQDADGIRASQGRIEALIAARARAGRRARAHRPRGLLPGRRHRAADGAAPSRAAGGHPRALDLSAAGRDRGRGGRAPPIATCRSSWRMAPRIR